MTLWHQSGVNRKGEPFVQLMIDDKVVGQFSPEECRDHARSILEAAEAAEQDAFMLDFAKGTIGTTEEGSVRLLQEFRRYREERGKKGPPSDRRDFMVTDKHEKPPEESA
jgi:hypothetical protein